MILGILSSIYVFGAIIYFIACSIVLFEACRVTTEEITVVFVVKKILWYTGLCIIWPLEVVWRIYY